MQRMAVDFPDPDGPMITTFSPRRTVRLIPFSTWKSPYHLLTSRISMIGAPSAAARFCVAMASVGSWLERFGPGASDIGVTSPRKVMLAAPAAAKATLQPLAVLRHRIA